MSALWLPVALALSFGAACDAPICVTGLGPEYCPDTETLTMSLENASPAAQLCSVVIEKADDAGAWQEYSADALGREAFPRKVTAFKLEKGQSRRVEWYPRRTGNYFELREGRYRIIVSALADGAAAATRHVVAGFTVSKEACGRGTPR